MNASKDQLLSIHEIGEVMADSLVAYFSKNINQLIISKCLNNGLIFAPVKVIKSSIISNKVFVFTGNLQNMKRKDAIDIIESYDGKISSSISSKTDYLVLGNKAGNKLKKAQDNEVTILTEDDFYKLINNIKNT